MTRFHLSLIVAVLVAAGAVLTHSFILLMATVCGWLTIVGLGVALPALSFFGNFICRGSTSKKRVALTFDDGPDPRATPQLLELLHAQKIPATFFCLGRRVEAHPELTAQIHRKGHLLGNHSYGHSHFINFYSSARLQAELTQAQTAFQKVVGFTPTFFRPPVGLSNPNTFRTARKLNLQVIGWTIRSLDTVIADPGKIIARITRRLRPGAIILLHDGNLPAEKLLATVKTLLDTLRSLGYEVVRLDELLK
ncbi:MAG TPA: polysaccharide deacetylase family protein [Verrucomicrobiae bacterium]|jgi:peptidoglycan/xylan/chitin deacetylase (PgdA/CDA1 family)